MQGIPIGIIIIYFNVETCKNVRLLQKKNDNKNNDSDRNNSYLCTIWNSCTSARKRRDRKSDLFPHPSYI